MLNTSAHDRLRRRLFLLLGAVCLLLMCDQMAKALIRLLLLPDEQVTLVPGILSFYYRVNDTGFSWWVPALPRWAGFVFQCLLAAICVLAIPVYLYYSVYRRSSKWADLAFVGITSALCGHLADDLFVPYTTDFIRLGRGPSANLADLYSYVGLTALFIEMMLCRRKNTEQGGGIRDRLARMCKTRRHFVRFLAGELWRILFSAGRDTESSGASRK